MPCPDCTATADELAQVRRLWARTRRRYQALVERHEYLLTAWQNECTINERLRAELRQLQDHDQ